MLEVASKHDARLVEQALCPNNEDVVAIGGGCIDQTPSASTKLDAGPGGSGLIGAGIRAKRVPLQIC